METLHLTKKEVVAAFRTREILAAARRLLERHGVEAATMEEIAQAAGVAKGTIYLYFQSKEELLRALLSQVGEGMAGELEALLQEPGSHREKLERVMTLLMDYVERERRLFPIYLREMVKAKAGRGSQVQSFQKVEERIIGILTRLFADGIAAGEFIEADPRLLAFLLKGMVRAVGYFQLTQGAGAIVPETRQLVWKLWCSGILSPAAGSGAGGDTCGGAP